MTERLSSVSIEMYGNFSRRGFLGASAAVLATASGPALRAQEGSLPSAGPAVPEDRLPRTVVYLGNDPASVPAFEAWFGRQVDGVQIHTGSADWSDWAGSISWLIERWAVAERPIYWSIPLMAQGSGLADVAAGDVAGVYREAAQQLAATTPHEVYVRTGWEFNGDWMHWSAVGRASEYISAYRRFVDTFRTASDGFVFEWCPNVGDYGMDPERAYPGDEYVDIIGMDFYYNTRWMTSDPMEAWEAMVRRPYGLRWHADFAASRGKPTAYAEWGVESETAAPYVRAAAHWFRQQSTLYQSYWNSNADFQGKLSEGQYPAVGAAYREEFG